MPTLNEKLLTLRFMGDLNASAREKVVRAFEATGTEKTLPPATQIFQEGDLDSDKGYVLLQGDIRVLKPSAPEIVVSAPELLGEMARFNPTAARTATIEAVDEVRVLAFAWSRFDEALTRMCSPEESEQIQNVLHGYAWDHFTE